MPRAHRHFIPGQLWHITHRCHEKAFLLKFARDRRAYLHWLFEAKKRYGLCVLNYAVTSNHIHLLVTVDIVEKVKCELGMKARHRDVDKADGTCVLRAQRGSYTCILGAENSVLRAGNAIQWTRNI